MGESWVMHALPACFTTVAARTVLAGDVDSIVFSGAVPEGGANGFCRDYRVRGWFGYEDDSTWIASSTGPGDYLAA
jgi:hypothetical protein